MTIPTNVTDLIAAAKDGELGNFENIKIGDIVVGALTGLDTTESLRITRKPIQSGSVMTDAAVEDFQTLVWDVVFVNPQYSADDLATAAITGDLSALNSTWRDNRDQLYQYKNDREVLTVQDHDRVYSNCLISSITPAYDAENNLDAFVATITMERLSFYGDVDDNDNKISAALKNVGSL